MIVEAKNTASWSLPLWPCISIALAGAVYAHGWRLIHTTRPRELPGWRALCFFLGLAALWVAVASPIEALDDLLLAAHMTQHFLLMSVAPPLIALGAPAVPMLRGLPRPLLQWIEPLFRSATVRRISEVIRHPVFAWLAMNVAFVGWHIPRAFELALRSEAWHNVEHLCFFLTSLSFWWVVVQPWPNVGVWNRWAMVPYLVTADIVNTGLSAYLIFFGRVLYPTYAQAVRVFNISALDDQRAAGAGMWFFGSLVFFVAAIAIMHQLLNPSRRMFTTASVTASTQGDA